MEAVLIQSPHLRWVGRLKNYSIYSAGIIREVVTEKYRTVTNYLHGNQSKCICYRAKQDNCCKYRAEVFDHKVKNLFPAECALSVHDLLFHPLHSDDSRYKQACEHCRNRHHHRVRQKIKEIQKLHADNFNAY